MSRWRNAAGATARERVHYFSRQLLTAEDMLDEQRFFLQKLRRHNRYLHGWGVVCGCTISPAPTSQYPWRVCISPGYVLDPLGNEICLEEPIYFDVAAHWPPAHDPCAPPPSSSPAPTASVAPVLVAGGNADNARTALVALCYDECNARPVRVHPAGCGCDEAGCEYSRIRDSVCVEVLLDLPEYHKKAIAADAKWLAEMKAWVDSGSDGPRRVPPCPDAAGDPCVVIAAVTLPAASQPLDASSINNNARRVLYSVHSLEGLVRGLA